MSAGTWVSWSGLATAHPIRDLTPTSEAEVSEAVVAAHGAGLRVKMVGTGHSFSSIATTDGLLLHPGRLTGIIGVDREAMTVTARAGTPLHELNAALESLGLSLHNMGDIDRQTLAGAISTGTHGTGGVRASLSAQVVGLELVIGDGSVLRCDATTHPDVFDAARLGLGAVGILTSVTFAVEPLFLLQAEERPSTWADALAGWDDMVAAHHHAEMYWFPHTDLVQTKCNDRTLDERRPLGRVRAWFDDDLMANTAFGWANALGNRAPSLVPRINRALTIGLSDRSYCDVAHRVFVSPRRVVFREMEYAVPVEVGLEALTAARRLIEARGWRISFPVEVRTAPADDLPLSMATGRDSMYLAFHVNARTDHREYFSEIERLLRDFGGRAHWGKVHTRTAADLEPDYPRWAEFAMTRERVDPDRIFANPYLEQVLGP